MDFFTDPANPTVVKEFYFVIRATGHDSPKEQDGAGIKSWLYTFLRTSSGTIERLNQSGFWSDAMTVNVLADSVRLVRRYRYDPADPSYWQEDFANLPGYLNQEYDVTVRGRDLGLTDIYEQFIYVRPDPFPEPVVKLRLNTYNTSPVARWTGLQGQRVYLTMKK